jgi:hypothetical protein
VPDIKGDLAKGAAAGIDGWWVLFAEPHNRNQVAFKGKATRMASVRVDVFVVYRERPKP